MRKRILPLVLTVCCFFISLPKVATVVEAYSLSDNATLTFEAEDNLTASGSAKNLLQSDSLASKGKAVSTVNANDTSTSVNASPDLKVTVNVTTPGMYTLYFNMKTQDSYITYYVKVDGGTGKWIGLNNLVNNGPYQNNAMDAFFLTSGSHTVEIIFRSGRYSVDQLVLSTVGDPDCLSSGSYNVSKLTNNKYTYTDTKPAALTNKMHPRLILQADQVQTVKENLQAEQNKDVWERLKTEADQSFNSCTLSTSTANNENYRKLAYIEANAFLWAISDQSTDDDDKRAENAVTGIKEYLSTYRVAHGNTVKEEREALNTVFRASLVYDWCYDYLTDSDKNEIINACIKLFTASTVGKEIKNTSLNAYNSNHMEEYMVMKNMLGFSIAVFDEYPKIYSDTWQYLKEQMVPSRNFRYEENDFNPQGDDYGGCRSTADWYFKLLLTQMDKGNLLTENQHMQPYSHVYRRNPNGAFMRDGDSYEPPILFGYVHDYTATEFFLSSLLYQDEYLKQEFYKVYRNGEFLGMQDSYISPAMFLILNDVNLGTKDKSELPLSKYFGDKSGVMVARTGWEDGIKSNVMTVSMKAPENNMGGHEHQDAGHFYIYYKGPLALDSGAYTSAGNAHYNNYMTQTVAHNSMLIDGNGQRKIPSIDTYAKMSSHTQYGEVLGYDYGPDMTEPSYTYLKGDLTKAYGTDLAQDYTRSFLFFNFFDEIYPGALVVFDRVTSAASDASKTWLLHAQQEPQIDGNTVTVSNSGGDYNGRLINETLLPKADNLKIQTVKGYVNQGVEYPAEPDYFSSAEAYRWAEECGNYRVEISADNTEQTEYFLNVLQVSENDSQIVKLPSSLYETDGFYGVKIKDRVGYFSKNKDRTANTVTVTSEGTETLQYAVCDLKAGSWQIYKDNALYGTMAVPENSGVGSFSGTGGTYRLVYAGGSAPVKDFNILNATSPKAKTPVLFDNDTKISNTFAGKNYLYLEEKPEVKDNILYMPLSAVPEIAGSAAVTETQMSVTNGSRNIAFYPDSAKVSVGGKDYLCEGASYRKNDEWYVPASGLEGVLQKEFTYQPLSAIISMKANSSIAATSGLTLLENRITAFPDTFGNETEESVSFATVSSQSVSDYTLKEYGMLLHPSVEKMEYNTPGVQVLQAKKQLSGNGHFGIRLVDTVHLLPESYWLRPYSIYENAQGERLYFYSENSIFASKES